MILWEDRDPKMKGPKEFGYNPYGPDARKRSSFDRWYDYVMLDWMPLQPDMNQLRAIFVDDCNYDILHLMVRMQKHSRKDLGIPDDFLGTKKSEVEAPQ